MKKNLLKYIFLFLILFTISNSIDNVNAEGLNQDGNAGMVCQYYRLGIEEEYYLIMENNSEEYNFLDKEIRNISNEKYTKCPSYIYKFRFNGDGSSFITGFLPLYWFSDDNMGFDEFDSSLSIIHVYDTIEAFEKYIYSGNYYGMDILTPQNVNVAKSTLNAAFDPPVASTVGCAILTDTIKEKINWILNLLKYGGVALAILLGMVDFMKAVGSDEDNATKIASSKLAKRLIAAALIFLIPLLLQFLLNTIDIPGITKDDVTCGIGVSE